MSMSMEIETGKMRVYDKDGRTSIPDDIMNALGITEGDQIKLVVENGKIEGEVIENGQGK